MMRDDDFCFLRNRPRTLSQAGTGPEADRAGKGSEQRGGGTPLKGQDDQLGREKKYMSVFSPFNVCSVQNLSREAVEWWTFWHQIQIKKYAL